jgi:hypothetical protein
VRSGSGEGDGSGDIQIFAVCVGYEIRDDALLHRGVFGFHHNAFIKSVFVFTLELKKNGKGGKG